MPAHKDVFFIGRSLVEIELAQGQEVVTHRFVPLHANRAFGQFLLTIDTGMAVDGLQIYRRQHMNQFGRHPRPMFAQAASHHHVEIERRLTDRLPDDAAHRCRLATVAQHLPHGILTAKKPAGTILGQHHVGRCFQRRLACPHRITEKTKEHRICHQHIGLETPVALQHIVVLVQDKPASLQHLTVGNIDCIRIDPAAVYEGRGNITRYIPQGDYNVFAVNTVRIHCVLAVQVSRQHDAASQA